MNTKASSLLAASIILALPFTGVIADEVGAFPPLKVKTEIVAEGLVSPVFITAAPGDTTRLFVVEQGGTIMIIEDGVTLAQPFLDLTDRVVTGGERGLLSMAFDPDFSENGRFYVNYTGAGNATFVSRFQVKSKNPNIALKKSERVILSIKQPYTNHNGGQLQFGPDGYLYIGMGDGGSGGDPLNNGQDLTSRLGAMLRIDVNELPYSIPSTNPFVNPVTSGIIAHPEIWAYGLRNPWRFSFDRETGDLYIADVGQGLYEEINFQPAKSGAGWNYGWNILEGYHPYKINGRSTAGLVDPVHEYRHVDGNCSVTGGYVYRGKAIKRLKGTYFFADYCSGRIWTFKYSGGKKTAFIDRTNEMGGPFKFIVSFGEDADGELYFCTLGGTIYKIVN